MVMGDIDLPVLDNVVHEFVDSAAAYAYQMIVMRSLIQLENRMPTLEMMARDQPRPFELGQYAIHRGQTHVLPGIEQGFIHILRAEMPAVARLEDMQYAQPR